jgi:hypothetical protein
MQRTLARCRDDAAAEEATVRDVGFGMPDSGVFVQLNACCFFICEYKNCEDELARFISGSDRRAQNFV